MNFEVNNPLAFARVVVTKHPLSVMGPSPPPPRIIYVALRHSALLPLFLKNILKPPPTGAYPKNIHTCGYQLPSALLCHVIRRICTYIACRDTFSMLLTFSPHAHKLTLIDYYASNTNHHCNLGCVCTHVWWRRCIVQGTIRAHYAINYTLHSARAIRAIEHNVLMTPLQIFTIFYDSLF